MSNLFKKASSEIEIADAMEQFQAEATFNDDSVVEQKRLEAFAYLNEAAQAFDSVGLTKKAEQLTLFIEKVGQDSFEEEKPGIEEREQFEEPSDEIIPDESDDKPMTAQEALFTLGDYHDKTQSGDASAMNEYIPGLMYLRTIMQGEPNKVFFSKFNQKNVPSWVNKISKISPSALNYVIKRHLEETGAGFTSLDNAVRRYVSETPKALSNPVSETASETVSEERSPEELLKANIEKIVNETPLPKLTDMTVREEAAYRHFLEGVPLTKGEQDILNQKREEAYANVRQWLEEREQTVRKKEKIDKDFIAKEREERAQARREKMKEFAPSDVRKINPRTGLPVANIPVELSEKGRGKWTAMTPEERAKQRTRSPRVPSAPVSQIPAAPTRARVYPEGGIYILQLPGDARKRRFKEEEQAVNFGEKNVGKGNVTVLKAPPDEVTASVSPMDKLQKLAECYCKNTDKPKNPGKNKDEKEVYRHFGYNDADDMEDESWEEESE